MEDKMKRIILLAIPMSICNLRCHYCYLGQREEAFQGKQANMLYSPEYVAKAFSEKRMGGKCFFNICADGETLLVKDIDKYIFSLAKEGHYIEIVTNMTVSSTIDKILLADQEILNHIMFKCSFHYLQLKEKGLLNIFAENVNKVWNHNCSASIEITPNDELIPYIEEVKKFSYLHFGALPHLTIARNDREKQDYLTSLSLEEYDRIWSQFDSELWRFKRSIFNIKRKEYCYAGEWSLYVNLENGDTSQCYCSHFSQNIFENIEQPILFKSIGNCQLSHCYNGHALLTLGCIPELVTTTYSEVRNRKTLEGKEWVQAGMKKFIDSKLADSNNEKNMLVKRWNKIKYFMQK